MSRFEKYSESFRHVGLERRDGVLKIAIHHEGGPAKMSSYPGGLHEELGDVFYEVGRDSDNKVVIFTGTGDVFMTEFDRSVPNEDRFTPLGRDRIYKHGKDLLKNLLEIEAPVIGAVNGPALVHPELLTLSDLVIASDRASFHDGHVPRGLVPGDGATVWWTMLLGPNRGRQFLMTGEEIGAAEAKQLGFVAEIVPHDQLLDRAWEIAFELAAKPQMMLRYMRVCFTQHIRRRMLDDLGHGLSLQNVAALAAFQK